VIVFYLLLFAQPLADAPVTVPAEMLQPAALRAVQGLDAADSPNDGGSSIDVWWEDSPDSRRIATYKVLRADAPDGEYTELVEFLVPTTAYTDTDIEDNKEYFYRIDVVSRDGQVASATMAEPVVSRPQWFHSGRIPILAFILIYGILVILYIELAKKDKDMFIRRIAGLDAIDEAVGRSTEMGKPILYSFGIGYLTDVATIASLSILRRVAKRAAEYETRILVPNYDPIVMTAAQETVKQGFVEAGRPDLYNANDITFLTQDQFGYAAGVDGIMLREQPGTVFLQGVFYAEALILAETAHSVGAIQIAGTDRATQLPFFVAACDYTLIGEELFAASAYLDRDPQLMGSLKSEDLAKLIIVLAMVAAAVVGTTGAVLSFISGVETNFFTDLFEKLTGFLNTT
jgi:hypothetical protein